MKEFSDVFLKELPGLPPDRVVTFGINVLPKTAQAFIAPYRMASEVMKSSMRIKLILQDK